MRRFDGKKLVIATHNQGKLEEIADLLRPYGVSLTSNADHGLPEPEETETTFVGNARIKAHAAAQATGLPELSDDSAPNRLTIRLKPDEGMELSLMSNEHDQGGFALRTVSLYLS